MPKPPVGDEAAELAGQVLAVVAELEEEDTQVGCDDFVAAKREAERMAAQGSAGEALLSSMVALEELMVASKLKEQAMIARLREILWLAKDAAAVFKDAGDVVGEIAALCTVTRAHLLRGNEPDAPVSALKAAKEAEGLFHDTDDVDDQRVKAHILLLVGESHVAKATGTPYENVLLEQVAAAAEAARGAEDIYRDVDDIRGQAKALHVLARALLRHTDEDEALDGERACDDAREMFQDVGDQASEVAVILTAIGARQVTSGPESALMMASDAAEDWKAEGNRPRDAALALLLSASFQNELGEYQEALKGCTEAQQLSNGAGDRRGMASALETKSAVFAKMKQWDEATQCLEEMSTVYQRMGEKKMQGNALVLAANMQLNRLFEEVEQDTTAEFEKNDKKVGLSTSDVHRRSAEGVEYANKASRLFDEVDDEEGKHSVGELIQNIYNKAIHLYCKTKDPDQIYYMLEKDSPLEDTSKCIKEWKIPVPAFKKTEGLDGSDGFLHIFDPHPPPGL